MTELHCELKKRILEGGLLLYQAEDGFAAIISEVWVVTKDDNKNLAFPRYLKITIEAEDR